MRLRYLFAGVFGLVLTSPVLAATSIGGGSCGTDLSIGSGSSLISCYGRYSGNILNNASNAQLNAALDALGYTGSDISYSAIASSDILNLTSGAGATVDFPGLMNGIYYVGIHTGNGGSMGVGNQTSVYKISAANLDAFTLNPSGGSTATLLAFTPASVPEPATWGMMIVGFGAVGGLTRRRGSGLMGRRTA